MGSTSGKGNDMDEKKVIYIGSDHAGFNLKKYLKLFLTKSGFEVFDMGNENYEPGDDYPEYSIKVAEKVRDTSYPGILICGSGVGACIAANKVKGIRAVDAADVPIARQSREHINTNILCLGQNYISADLAKKIVRAWLETGFSSEERHRRRVDQIEKI
jgi:ribose 5-phosphate isomerase B